MDNDLMADSLARRDSQAAVLMLVTVLGNSVFPLVVALVGNRANPIVFHIYFAIPISFVWLTFLVTKYRRVSVRRDLWVFTVRRLSSLDGIRALSATFNVSLFVAASYFLDTAIVVVIFNAWAFLFVLWQKRNDRQGRYRDVTWEKRSLLITAFVGLGLVTISQAGGIYIGDDGWNLMIGFGLAATGALFGSWISYRFKVGLDLWQYYSSQNSSGQNSSEEAGNSEEAGFSELGCQVFVMIVTAVGGIIINLLIVVIVMPSLTDSVFRPFALRDVLMIIAAATISASSSIVFRYANLKTSNLGINAMTYLTPVMSLLWLWLFDTVRLVRPEFLTIGAMAVIVANVLINFQAEDRAGFRALVLWLLVFGFVVYMRHEWFEPIVIYDKFTNFGDYYGPLALAATLFILILSFRTSRLNRRTTEEAQKVFSLYRTMRSHYAIGTINEDMTENIRIIDTTNNTIELKVTYQLVQSAIKGSGLDAAEKSRIGAELDMLAYSKQQGRNWAELIVLVMLAVAIVGGAVLGEPEAVAWTRWLNNMFSMLFATVTVFMSVHLFDQRYDRDHHILAEDGSGVKFKDSIRLKDYDMKLERWITIGIGFVVIGVYAVLMFP